VRKIVEQLALPLLAALSRAALDRLILLVEILQKQKPSQWDGFCFLWSG
jgi:hypothetical protein